MMTSHSFFAATALFAVAFVGLSGASDASPQDRKFSCETEQGEFRGTARINAGQGRVGRHIAFVEGRFFTDDTRKNSFRVIFEDPDLGAYRMHAIDDATGNGEPRRITFEGMTVKEDTRVYVDALFDTPDGSIDRCRARVS